jgi:4-amino-4-deoxy-L-arabinose transferase-like glycosyltransferase
MVAGQRKIGANYARLCRQIILNDPMQFMARFSANPYIIAFLLAAVFFILLLPLTENVTRWRGDERLYTDAALQMRASGDWLTSRYSDGTLRFRKPGMTYWSLLASYRLFGVGLASSRLPALAAGALTLGLTFLLGFSVYRRIRPALAGALLLGATSTMLKMSLRATPDMLLALFMTLSCYGLVRAVKAERRHHLFLLLGYGGAGLAVATKGLSGLLPPLFAWLWCLLERRRGARPGHLVSWPAILFAAAIAGLWYVLIYLQYGGVAMKEFFGDQVAERFHENPLRGLGFLVLYPLDLVFNLLPWSLAAVVVVRMASGKVRDFLAAHRSFLLLTAIWAVGFLLVFSAGNMYRVRYFLPLYPLLCVVLGGLLSLDGVPNVGGRLRAWVRGLYGVLGLTLAGMLLLGACMGVGMVWLYGVLGATALVGAGFCRRGWWLPLTAVALLSMTMLFDLTVHPVFYPRPAREVAAQLAAVHAQGHDTAALGDMKDVVSQVRLLMGARIEPEILEADTPPEKWRAYRVLMVTGPWKETLEQAGYQLLEAGYTLPRMKQGKWLRSILALGPAAAYEQRKQRCYVAVAPATP